MTDGHHLAPSRAAIDAKLRAILCDVLGWSAKEVASLVAGGAHSTEVLASRAADDRRAVDIRGCEAPG